MKLQVTQLDFEESKTNLKQFLSTQDKFADYDFEGSSMSVLMDMLAYVTQYMGFQANMVVNESFLDTAQQRNSVVSKAKELGYIPKTIQSATSIVELDVDAPDLPDTIIVNKNTQFTSKINGKTYPFTNLEAYTIKQDALGGYQTELKLVQGEMKTQTWTVDSTIEAQKYYIEYDNIDSSHISLTVNDVFFTHNEDLTLANAESRNYFVQEGLDGTLEVYFGDGTFGVKPEHEDVIKVELLKTSGDLGNYTSTITDQVFGITQNIGIKYNSDGTVNNIGYAPDKVIVSTIDRSTLGAEPESIDSIKFTAPKVYERQGRAVTSDDYKTILEENFNDIDSLAVWGGEDNIPPQYGAVFISIKPKHGLELSPITKNRITEEILKPYNILAITPVLVSPEYTYIDVKTTVKYDPLRTQLSSGEVEKLVTAEIELYFDKELGRFDEYLKYSRLMQTIDNAESSISNNLTTIRLFKRFQLVASNTVGNYEFQFNNEIVKGSIVSTTFGSTSSGSTMALLDNGQGQLMLYNVVDGTFISLSAGTVDYENGIVRIEGFNPEMDNNTIISIFAEPKQPDISTVRNNLLVLNESTVAMETV